jgi:hypothetical protein
LREGILRVDAVSVGRPKGITTATPGRKLLTVRESEDNERWLLEVDSKPITWHKTVLDAVNYAASKTMGYVSEARLLDVKGRMTHVILIPKNGQS